MLALLLGGILAFTSAAPAWAATITRQDIPINRILTNPCNGESVILSGTAHTASSVTVDGTGQFHLTAHFTGKITGAGSQGHTYVAVLNEQVAGNRFGSVPGHLTHTFTTNLISIGSAPNFRTGVLQHFTVNADGTTAVSFVILPARCSG